MTKISTMFYLVDNTGNEESTEVAGRMLEMEYTDILGLLKKGNNPIPSDACVSKTIKMCKNI